jgi:hypothetical protein
MYSETPLTAISELIYYEPKTTMLRSTKWLAMAFTIIDINIIMTSKWRELATSE